MGIESINTGKPVITPLSDDIQTGDLSGVDQKKQLSPEEAAQLLQVLQQFDGGLRNGATQGVPEPEPETVARSDRVGGMSSSLDNAQTNLATDIYAFMAMYTKIAQQMRATAREQRQDQLQGQMAALTNAADKMVEAAEKRFSAALVQGITQIVGGAISIASGAYSLGKIANASKPAVDLEGNKVPPATDPFAPGSKFSLDLQAKQSLFTGSSQVVGGSGGMFSASLEKDAAKIDSDAKREEALGTKAQADREVQQDIVQTMGDLLRDIREQLRAMAQAEVESNKGMARNI